MDYRRLDTAGVIASGIIGMPAPKTEIPRDRDEFDPSTGAYGESLVELDQIVAAIERGEVITCSNYYGIPYAWKQADGVYRGTLLQYRAISEDPTFATANECAEWYRDRHWQTYG